jgi:hypothetical protein
MGGRPETGSSKDRNCGDGGNGAGGHSLSTNCRGGGKASCFGFRLNKREKNPNWLYLRLSGDGELLDGFQAPPTWRQVAKLSTRTDKPAKTSRARKI